MNKKLYIAGFIFIFLISFVSAGLIVGKTNENNKIVELVTPKPEEITQFLPFNYTVQAGIEDWGNISSINKSNDGFYLNVSEVGGSPAMTIIINFTGVTGFSNIIMRHKYSGGAGHIIRLGLFNCIGGDYEEEYPPDITDMEIFAFALYNVLDPDVHLCNGNVSLRIRQVDNGIAMHDFFLDFITLQLGATTIVAQEVDPFALYKDGSVIATGNFDWGGFNITNLDVVIANILTANLGRFVDAVGIGTDSPDSVFHIKAGLPGVIGSDFAGQLIIQNPADTVFSNAVITGYESDGDGNPDQQLWYLGSSSNGNTDIIFLNRRNAKLQLGTSGTSRITILGNGNVGIGTVTPSERLDLDNGSLTTTGNVTADRFFGKLTSNQATITSASITSAGIGILAVGSLFTGSISNSAGTTVNINDFLTATKITVDGIVIDNNRITSSSGNDFFLETFGTESPIEIRTSESQINILAQGDSLNLQSDGGRILIQAITDETVEIFGDNGINLFGDVEADGNIDLAGKLTSTGGNDPPYVLYNIETRESIVERIRQEVPESKAGGMALFYLPDMNRYESFNALTCTFYVQAIDDKTFEPYFKPVYIWDDGEVCYNTDSIMKYYWDKITETIKQKFSANYGTKIPRNFTLNRTSGEVFEKVIINVNYNDAVEVVQIPELEMINVTCSELDSTTLQVFNYDCTKEVETGKMIDKYKFKEDCGWDNGYYCEERVLRNFGVEQ